MPILTAAPLDMTADQRSKLEVMARSASLPHRAVQAKALLLAGDGVANEEIARRCETTPDTVRRWRARFGEQGVEGVGVIAKGRGRKPWLAEGTVAEVVRVTREDVPPDGSTHWTTRLLAKRFGIGKDSVARIWRDHNLKPWRVKIFKLSNDPDSRTSSSTWSGCTWTHRSGRWCSASTKRPSARRWTAPSPRCRCDRDGQRR